jgi:hypothetical protein
MEHHIHPLPYPKFGTLFIKHSPCVNLCLLRQKCTDPKLESIPLDLNECVNECQKHQSDETSLWPCLIDENQTHSSKMLIPTPEICSSIFDTINLKCQ